MHVYICFYCYLLLCGSIRSLFVCSFVTVEGSGEGAEDKTSAAEQKEEAAPTASESNEQQGEANEKGKGGTEGGKQTIFQDSPADVTVEETAPRVLEHLCVLRHLPEGRSPNISSVKYLIVVPFTKEKAEEAFKDGLVIDQEEVKGIQGKVDKLSK